MLTEEQRELVLNNMRLVYKAAVDRGKFNDPDAVQWGFIGLCKAAERYDPNRGVCFSTYAYNYIKWWLNGSYSDIMHSVRLTSGEILLTDDIESYDIQDASDEARGIVRDVMLSSGKVGREIIRLMYLGYTKSQITEKMSISRQELNNEIKRVRETCSDEIVIRSMHADENSNLPKKDR